MTFSNVSPPEVFVYKLPKIKLIKKGYKHNTYTYKHNAYNMTLLSTKRILQEATFKNSTDQVDRRTSS